jgi:hypothetical protein
MHAMFAQHVKTHVTWQICSHGICHWSGQKGTMVVKVAGYGSGLMARGGEDSVSIMEACGG